jgi:hypothetical protein
MTESDTDVSMNEIDVAISEKEDMLKDIRHMEYSIEDKKKKLEELDKKIAKICKHDFINDYIDTMFPYREGILITYCEYCELSKEFINSHR